MRRYRSVKWSRRDAGYKRLTARRRRAYVATLTSSAANITRARGESVGAGAVGDLGVKVTHCPPLPQAAREVHSCKFGRFTQALSVTWSSHDVGSPDRQQTKHGFGAAQVSASAKSPPEDSQSTGDSI